jgi:hypothetical protein
MDIFRTACSVVELTSSVSFSKILGINISLSEHKMYGLVKMKVKFCLHRRKEKREMQAFH